MPHTDNRKSKCCNASPQIHGGLYSWCYITCSKCGKHFVDKNNPTPMNHTPNNREVGCKECIINTPGGSQTYHKMKCGCQCQCHNSTPQSKECSCGGSITHKWSVHNSSKCYIDPKFDENWETDTTQPPQEPWEYFKAKSMKEMTLKSKLKHTGYVLTCNEYSGAGVICHEIMHAILFANGISKIKFKKQHPIIIHSINDEERLLYAFTDAIRQFYGWYWSLRDKNLLTNKK